MFTKIDNFSYQLNRAGVAGLNAVNMLSIGRYALCVLAFMERSHVEVCVVLICLAVLAHITCKPYSGFALIGFKVLESEDDFVPLKQWMVPGRKRELSGQEYQMVASRFTATTTKKMHEFGSAQKYLSVYDAVNLMLFEIQYSKPNEHRHKDEALKAEVKNKL